jgi:hypothetical protein
MHSTTIKLPGLTIDTSAVHLTLTDEGTMRLAGKVTLTFVDAIDLTSTVVTANYVEPMGSSEAVLCDFEGEDPASCEFAELMADLLASEINMHFVLGDASTHVIATQSDVEAWASHGSAL